MADSSPRRHPAIVIASAALAGVLAGAIAVYVMQSRDGNGPALASTECTATLATTARVNPFGKGEIAAFRVASSPEDLGALAFTGPDGEDVTLAGFGKTTLVNLWATWCVPCRTEMPTLDRLEAAFGGDDFAVVAINVDDEVRGRAFLEEIGIEHLAFYADPDGSVFSGLKKQGLVLGLPTTLLVDSSGCRIGSLQGPAEWDSDDAEALIGAALGR